ncbi:PAS domain S-box protein [Taklimakanibacter deserti]|uniref:PAS domain S-box protein n=1 Tax=Taklimakanibacter deserti TaxID=2267839 RepID=UPI000E6462B1
MADSTRRRLLTRGLFQQRTFFELTDRLYRGHSLSDAYEATLDAIRELLGCERASILRFDSKGVMRFVAWRELSQAYRQAVDGHSPWRPGTRDPEPIYVSDIAQSGESEELKQVVLGEGIQALAFIPLTFNRATIGKFMVYHAAPHEFTDEEREIALTLARQLSFAIERETADLAGSRLAALIDSSEDAIVSKNLDGIIQSWNPGAERLFGYSAPEAIDKPITIVIPDDRLDEETSILARIRKGERVEPYETVRRRKDGSLVHVSLAVSPIVDPQGMILGASKIARDMTTQHLAHERQQLLLREMNHRVKNLFAVTSSLISLNSRSATSVRELAASVTERLTALGRAHALTMSGGEAGEHSASLHSLTEALLAPYNEREKPRVSISGDDMRLAAKAITPMALLLHEFATNAAKYGALSNDAGRVEIGFSVEGDVVKVVWSETGVSQPADKPDNGFGSLLVQATVTQLGGRMDREWTTEGLRISLDLSGPLLAPPVD